MTRRNADHAYLVLQYWNTWNCWEFLCHEQHSQGGINFLPQVICMVRYIIGSNLLLKEWSSARFREQMMMYNTSSNNQNQMLALFPFRNQCLLVFLISSLNVRAPVRNTCQLPWVPTCCCWIEKETFSAMNRIEQCLILTWDCFLLFVWHENESNWQRNGSRTNAMSIRKRLRDSL